MCVGCIEQLREAVSIAENRLADAEATGRAAVRALALILFWCDDPEGCQQEHCAAARAVLATDTARAWLSEVQE